MTKETKLRQKARHKSISGTRKINTKGQKEENKKER